MGHGTYSIANATLNSTTTRSTYAHKDAGVSYDNIRDAFKNRKINDAMSPYGVKVRESRDSEDHPNTFPFIIALDETGSMGSVPHYLCKEGFIHVMDRIMKGGQNDAQALFMGIGDHECDQSPLQVGQFESSDELLDKWLTSVYLEGRGGGNDGESYLLAWYFAAMHTATDAWDKRKQKGILFTVGDEPTLKTLPESAIKKLMGCDEAKTWSHTELLAKACERYHVYHIHVTETMSGSQKDVQDGWKQLMGDNVLFADNKQDITTLISSKVLEHSTKDETTTTSTTTSDEVIL